MVNFVKGLNRDLIDIIFDRVTTDGNIYTRCTLSALTEIALEINIGLIQDNGTGKVWEFFKPAIDRAIRDLLKEGNIAASIGDYSLKNELCSRNLHKDYYVEIGNLLFKEYEESILYILNNNQF